MAGLRLFGRKWTSEALCALNHDPRPKVRPKCRAPGVGLTRIINMAGSDLPRHIVDRFERRWAQKLESQARTWQSEKVGGRTLTDGGVTVVRRRKRPKLVKAPAT